jgi:hypothetical protein
VRYLKYVSIIYAIRSRIIHSLDQIRQSDVPGVVAGEANAVDEEEAVVEHASLYTSESVDILGAKESLFLVPSGPFLRLLRNLAKFDNLSLNH